MNMSSLRRDAEVVAGAACTIDQSAHIFDAQVQRAAAGQVVFMGEASHGTHEFYETRAVLVESLRS